MSPYSGIFNVYYCASTTCDCPQYNCAIVAVYSAIVVTYSTIVVAYILRDRCPNHSTELVL